VFIVLWLPAIINRFQSFFDDEEVFILVLLHSVFVPLQGEKMRLLVFEYCYSNKLKSMFVLFFFKKGFVNALIYGATEEGMLVSCVLFEKTYNTVFKKSKHNKFL
jgi:hypothetical protein